MRFFKENNKNLGIIELEPIVYELLRRERFIETNEVLRTTKTVVVSQNHILQKEYDTAVHHYEIRQEVIAGPRRQLKWFEGANQNNPHYADSDKPFPTDAFDERYIATTALVKSARASSGTGYYAFLQVPGIHKDFHYRSMILLKRGDTVFVKLAFHKSKYINRRDGVDTKKVYIPPSVQIADISTDTPFKLDIPAHVLDIEPV